MSWAGDFVRRGALIVIALILGATGCLSIANTAAAASPPRQVHTHAYDAAARVEPLTNAAPERGPPTTGHSDTTLTTLDHVSSRASARSDGAATHTYTTYASRPGIAQGRTPTGTTTPPAELIDGDLLSLQRGHVAANKGPTTLFHYTDEAGQRGILESGRLNPSLKSVSPKDARYGDGQYLTDIAPGTKTCAQLSACFLGIPFQGRKFTHYVEIDVSGLNIVKGRDGVLVNRSGDPLDMTRRLMSAGMN